MQKIVFLSRVAIRVLRQREEQDKKDQIDRSALSRCRSDFPSESGFLITLRGYLRYFFNKINQFLLLVDG